MLTFEKTYQYIFYKTHICDTAMSPEWIKIQTKSIVYLIGHFQELEINLL